MEEMTIEEVTDKVTEILAVLSSYAQWRILEIMEYSEDTDLQLVSLLSVAHKDTLAYRLAKAFDIIDQQDLYDLLFVKIKTVEKLIAHIAEKYGLIENETDNDMI